MKNKEGATWLKKWLRALKAYKTFLNCKCPNWSILFLIRDQVARKSAA